MPVRRLTPVDAGVVLFPHLHKIQRAAVPEEPLRPLAGHQRAAIFEPGDARSRVTLGLTVQGDRLTTHHQLIGRLLGDARSADIACGRSEDEVRSRGGRSAVVGRVRMMGR